MKYVILNKNPFTESISIENIYYGLDQDNFTATSEWLYYLFYTELNGGGDTNTQNNIEFNAGPVTEPIYCVLGGAGGPGIYGLSQPDANGGQGYGNGGNGGEIISQTLSENQNYLFVVGETNLPVPTSVLIPDSTNQWIQWNTLYTAQSNYVTSTDGTPVQFNDDSSSSTVNLGAAGSPGKAASPSTTTQGYYNGGNGGNANISAMIGSNLSLLGINVAAATTAYEGYPKTENSVPVNAGNGGLGALSFGGGGGGEGGDAPEYENPTPSLAAPKIGSIPIIWGAGGQGNIGGSGFILIYYKSPNYNPNSSTAALVSEKGNVFKAEYKDVNGIYSVLTLGDPRFQNKTWYDAGTGDFYQPAAPADATRDLKSYKEIPGASDRFGGLVTRETTLNGNTRLTFDHESFATQFPELTSLGYFDQTLNKRFQGMNPTGLIAHLVVALNEQTNTVNQHKQTLANQQQTLVKQRKRLNKQLNALKKQNQLLAGLFGKR
jgi:hypothetical protein